MTDNRAGTPGKRFSGMLKSTLLFILMLVVAFAMIEGIAATALFGYDLFSSLMRTTLRSSIYTEADNLLGWRTIPNLYLPDVFAPGQEFRSNDQGFRNAQHISAARPPNSIRAVCSGDSFTLGQGVSNANTWCSMFATARPDVESANLGLSGYGIGQAYLRYCRDAAGVAHDIHIFAPITDDFRRMQLAKFVGANKPYFTVKDGALSLENVPVPETSRLAVWWTLNSGVFTELRSAQFINKLIARLSGPHRPATGSATRPGKQAFRELAWKILEQVYETTTARNAKLVLVYLPEQATPMREGEDWRRLMEAFAAEHNVTFVDIYSHVHRLPVEQRVKLYSPVWEHFSVAGNQLVSDLIWAALGKDWQPPLPQHPVPDEPDTALCPTAALQGRGTETPDE